MSYFVLLVVVALAGFAAAEHYINKWDNLPLEEILANKALVAKYKACLLDQGRCTPDAKELRVASSSTLQVDFCNIRGLHINLNVVHHHLETTQPTLFLLTETKISCPDDALYLMYPGYKLEYQFVAQAGVYKIPDALTNKCEKCTDRQKEMTKIVIKHLVNNEPAAWEELKAKHDPTNKYSAEYEKELREILA